LVVVADGILATPCFVAFICFDWKADSGFSSAYLYPPNRKVGPLWRAFAYVIALEARPFIAHEFKKAGWVEAKGWLPVNMIPIPPIVWGINHMVCSPRSLIPR
jgi:hypothetical protein